MNKAKIHKIIISLLAAAEVLTLFPLIFFGIASTMDNVEMVKSNMPIMMVMIFGAIYMAAVLVGAYKAISHLDRPAKAYVFLFIPLVLISLVVAYNVLQA